MTASDSDCSIDWLASDDEDSSCGDVASESDCRRKAAGAGRATPKPEPEPSGAEPRGASAQRRAAAREGADDPDCAQSWDRPSGRQEPQTAPACRSGQKRPCCQGAPEPRGKPLEAEADKLLHYKCRELQCYILPLTSILNGLQSGRYRERLSSFQESVAMDRIRRILGVLQNPCMGERYINIILKVEVMLKTWFPNVKPVDQQAGGHEQDAMPSKRQKISPVNMAPSISASVPASHCALPSNSKAQQASEATAPGAHSATNLKWLHTSPICSPAEEPSTRAPRQRATPRARAVTQDNAVSSSTDPDPEGDPAPNHKACPLPPQSQPPSGKISAPCLERLLKSTESIVTRRGVGGAVESGWS
ncbi:circadian-associated transcriptional repressor-like [Anguilla rostrata]|uniref:circadian-associated transcriptional repressor-like n=1 Tax=Anguilla rostrata TaxID=7938 RepID=UPI0030D53100